MFIDTCAIVRWMVTLPWRLLHLIGDWQGVTRCLALTTVRAAAVGKNQNHIKTSPPIKYLTIDPIKKWCMGKDALLRVESPPGLRFAVRQIYIEALWKRCEKSTFFARFPVRRNVNYRNTIRRPGGKSKLNSAHFSYTSLFGASNIQILNCPWSSGIAEAQTDPQISKNAVATKNFDIRRTKNDVYKNDA